jgi:tryptophan halogenase
MIQTPPAPDALADRIISTLPSICGFHADLGLTEPDVISGARSALRIGTMFAGWTDGQADYVHAYGSCGAPVGVVPFHQLWSRHSASDALPPFDRFSPAAELARSGSQSQVIAQRVGLQLTLSRYAEMMRAYALHLGVQVRLGEIEHVELRSDNGFIDNVVLTGGDRVTGDLFVDCSGPSSLLQQHLDNRFIDWSNWLPCDRILLRETEPDAATVCLDRVAALPFGWRWTASSLQTGSIGIVYSSAHAEQVEPAQELQGGAESIAILQGRARDFWVGNCVAIGDASVTVEPLEWTNLHLVHSQVDRLIAMMPGRDCASVEIAEFNRECAAEADRVRDFLCLHYVCSSKPEPFWRAAASIMPPPSLQHTLSLFKERGRLPYYPEETFDRDSWLTVLFGQGVRPRRIDPLADLVSTQEAAQAFAAMRRSLQSHTLPAAGEPPELNPHGIR